MKKSSDFGGGSIIQGGNSANNPGCTKREQLEALVTIITKRGRDGSATRSEPNHQEGCTPAGVAKGGCWKGREKGKEEAFKEERERTELPLFQLKLVQQANKTTHEVQQANTHKGKRLSVEELKERDWM
ncbi:hypothetical protein NE237_012684 [Protea cynaroides]|uniref:Uncharacterized protein n=1 Tax=Protea cynaroides TaxID=273540 RepID=A0A9Q0GZK4_9MAGN|nr:hypothetical protein NE237_012684 [Protea cynaroides]